MSIGNVAFSVCKKLKKVRVSKALTKIPKEAFYECVKLTTVTFPAASKVILIDEQAFEDCRIMAKKML